MTESNFRYSRVVKRKYGLPKRLGSCGGAEIKGDVVTIRYQADLLPAYRVVIGNETFEIVCVKDILQPTRLIELGIRARADMPLAQGRWTARLGFLPSRVEQANDGESP
jgi:hypothetical protein